MTHRRKRLEKANAVVELDCRAMEVAISQEMVHADADLQDTFVEVANLVWGGSPQQLEGFVLFEEFARIELMNGPGELRWRGCGTSLDQVSRREAFDRSGQFWVGGARISRRQCKGYTSPTSACEET